MINDLVRIWDKLVSTIEKATVDNPTLKRRLGQETIKEVRDRTRKGLGVGKGKTDKLLKPLSDGYVFQRKTLRKSGKLSGETTPSKSNFTKTGEALDTLTFKVTKDGVNVTPKDEKNKIKFKDQDKNEREVLKLTKEEEQKLTNLVADEIVKSLKNFKV